MNLIQCHIRNKTTPFCFCYACRVRNVSDSCGFYVDFIFISIVCTRYCVWFYIHQWHIVIKNVESLNMQNEEALHDASRNSTKTSGNAKGRRKERRDTSSRSVKWCCRGLGISCFLSRALLTLAAASQASSSPEASKGKEAYWSYALELHNTPEKYSNRVIKMILLPSRKT